MTFLLIFLISFISTVFFTPYFIKSLMTYGVTDEPGGRHIHQISTPRMGGVILFSIFMIVTFIFYGDLNNVRLFIIGLVFIVICGVIDDIVDMRWSIKLIFQVFSTLLLIAYFYNKIENISFMGLVLYQPLGHIILFFFILGTLNSINLLDGMDGLVSGFSFIIGIISLVLAYLSNNYFILVVASALLGSVLGMLKFNAFPAKIFLGDSGSLFLGYVLIFMVIQDTLNYYEGNLELFFPVILFAIPIFDTLKVMLLRILQKRNPFLPDTNHIHHVIYNNRIRHKTTVFVLQLLTLAYAGCGLYYLRSGNNLVIIPVVILTLGLLFAKYILISFKAVEKITVYLNKLYMIPAILVGFYKNYVIQISVVIVLTIMLSAYNLNNSLSFSEMILFSLSGVILLIISYIHTLKSQLVNHIYVFFNLAAYFLISNSNKLINGGNASVIFLTFNSLIFICFIILLLIVALFLVIRERIIAKSDIFLTGMDLTMIVSIALSFLLQNFSDKLININYFSESLLLAFVIYLWYRIYILIKPKYNQPLFYLSFASPFLLILALWI